MKANVIVKKFLKFFEERGHVIIPSAPLIPENDPSTLFNTAGMQSLIPFLMGQPHPAGKRLTNAQKCFRTVDIDDVGDNRHNTFFEMLGNWSLGDYFKKEAITWSYEFLTKILKLDPNKLSVTVFKGDETAPRDEESYELWKGLGIPEERIYFFGQEENWWGLETGPCGPDTEIFFDTDAPKCGSDCDPSCDCGKYVEVWNNVFMQFEKKPDGSLVKLEQRNVDTGMGFSRIVAIKQGVDNVYDTDLFTKYFKILGKPTSDKSARVIADHTRGATFILGDEFGVTPGKSDQGYLLRRIIRKAVRHCKKIGLDPLVMLQVSEEVMNFYKERYPILLRKKEFILDELSKEIKRFEKTLDKGLKEFKKMTQGKKSLSGEDAFLLYQSYGFPIEITQELASEKGVKVDAKCFYTEFEKHKAASKKGSEDKFKGGLADSSEETTRLHTATHLLAEALRTVLNDPNIKQRGSNITPERLRFDFNYKRKLTPEELQQVEDLVNKMIQQNLCVGRDLVTYKEAVKRGAECEFEHKDSDKVYVYSIGDFSKEVCGGPHVANTKELGHFRIVKHKSVGAGVKRIRAVLE